MQTWINMVQVPAHIFETTNSTYTTTLQLFLNISSWEKNTHTVPASIICIQMYFSIHHRVNMQHLSYTHLSTRTKCIMWLTHEMFYIYQNIIVSFFHVTYTRTHTQSPFSVLLGFWNITRTKYIIYEKWSQVWSQNQNYVWVHH